MPKVEGSMELVRVVFGLLLDCLSTPLNRMDACFLLSLGRWEIHSWEVGEMCHAIGLCRLDLGKEEMVIFQGHCVLEADQLEVRRSKCRFRV